MNYYMTIKEAAALWGLSVRRVNVLCNEGRIDGVTKFGSSWAIPIEAGKPKDKRIKSGKYIKNKVSKEYNDN
ncbi:MAG: helix-turn-helix domain-containing protein [Lachnospiraceae bacterium]|nr:helix-turn-helix domain-containing protein [Lachnospiraceae bacterium]